MPLDQIDVEHDEKNMTFIDHLEELRWHIVRSVIVLIVLGILAFVFGSWIADNVIFAVWDSEFWTYRMLCSVGHSIRGTDVLCLMQNPPPLKNLNLLGQFLFHIKLSLIIGLIIGFPYLIFEFWKFLKPALKMNERKKTTGIVATSSLLFFLGVLFGYYVIVPLALNFASTYTVTDKINNDFTFQSYISILTNITLAAGIIFELPLVIFFLAKMGIVSSGLLKKNRKMFIVIALVLSAILTPPDVLSQVLLSIPLYILFEIGIRVAQRVEKRREEEEALA